MRNIFLDLLLPPRCPISGEIVDVAGAFSSRIWAGLTFIDAPQCARCGFPFEFTIDENAICGPCSANPPIFTKARSALAYDDASRDIVLAFKHGDKLESVPALIPFLKRAGALLIAEADVIVPVPLHPWRLLRRRYNQAGLLAQALGRAADKAVLIDALRRLRATPSQGHLNAGQRAKNVRKAFAVKPRAWPRVENKIILLIDDVYTTGATVNECARALLDAGAHKVHVLTLARVVKASRL